jgi:replicative DNA helicase
MNFMLIEEAESNVLSAVFLNPDALDEIADSLKADDFTKPSYRLVCSALTELRRRNEPITMLGVTDELKRRGKLELAGGPAGVSALGGLVRTAANIGYWAGAVRSISQRRAAAAEAQRVLTEAAAGPEDVEKWLDEVSRRFAKIGERGINNDITTMRDLVTPTFAEIEAITEGRTWPGIKTGLDELDKMLAGGFRQSELIVLAARPSVGKSALALQIALAAAGAGHVVACFSLEMSQSELMRRAYCMISVVPLDHLRPNGLQGEDWMAITRASSALASLPVVLDDTANLTAASIAARCRRIKREFGLDLVVVDYLQLIGEQRQRGDTRERAVADISRTLKLIARELSIPVIALSQLNRQPEEREAGRVRLADIRESGAIEQDADVVMSLYRPGMYAPDLYEAAYTRMEILKQRNGLSGVTIELAFNGASTSFAPWLGLRGGKRAAA